MFIDEPVDKLYFHENVFKLLNKISQSNNIPHIIFYGPSGSGKRTLCSQYLKMLFDNSIYAIKNVGYEVINSSGKVVVEQILQSDHHIIIQPKNTNYDRYLVHCIIKEYAKRMPFDIFKTNRTFNCIQINNADTLSYTAQSALRRMFEQFSDKCKFIMWCHSLSKIINPLRSRCLCIRISRPSKFELINYLIDFSANKGMVMTLKDYENIFEMSQGDIKKALWKLQFKYYNCDIVTNYNVHLDKIVNILLKTQNILQINILRTLVFDLMITNKTGTMILKDIIVRLLDIDISDEKKFNIIKCAKKIDYKLINCRREIIHFDLFFYEINNILNK